MCRDLQEVKRSLEFTRSEPDDLKVTLTSVTSGAIKHLQSNTEALLVNNKHCFAKVEYLENQSQRNNVTVDSIPESPSESWSDSEKKFREILSGKMKIDHKHTEIECAHCTGKLLCRNDSKKPSPMVVKLLRYKDKLRILSNAKILKGMNIYISEDYSAVRQKCKESIPQMKTERARGFLVHLSYC